MNPLELLGRSLRYRTLSILALCLGLAGETVLASDRSRELNFEENVVEGVNKKPLDSLSQISEKDRRDDAHLYMKREKFRDLNRHSIRELRFNQ